MVHSLYLKICFIVFQIYEFRAFRHEISESVIRDGGDAFEGGLRDLY